MCKTVKHSCSKCTHLQSITPSCNDAQCGTFVCDVCFHVNTVPVHLTLPSFQNRKDPQSNAENGGKSAGIFRSGAFRRFVTKAVPEAFPEIPESLRIPLAETQGKAEATPQVQQSSVSAIRPYGDAYRNKGPSQTGNQAYTAYSIVQKTAPPLQRDVPKTAEPSTQWKRAPAPPSSPVTATEVKPSGKPAKDPETKPKPETKHAWQRSGPTTVGLSTRPQRSSQNQLPDTVEVRPGEIPNENPEKKPKAEPIRPRALAAVAGSILPQRSSQHQSKPAMEIKPSRASHEQTERKRKAEQERPYVPKTAESSALLQQNSQPQARCPVEAERSRKLEGPPKKRIAGPTRIEEAKKSTNDDLTLRRNQSTAFPPFARPQSHVDVDGEAQDPSMKQPHRKCNLSGFAKAPKIKLVHDSFGGHLMGVTPRTATFSEQWVREALGPVDDACLSMKKEQEEEEEEAYAIWRMAQEAIQCS